MNDIEALCKLKKTRNLADDNLFGGLWVNEWIVRERNRLGPGSGPIYMS